MSTVETALGAVDTADLGPTLSHEHLFINLMLERRGDGLVHEEQLVVDELQVFADQGGGTIFDLTTAELTPGSTTASKPTFTATAAGETRDPENVAAIQRVSRATGVNVVLGAGRYRDPFMSRDLIDRLGVDGIAEEIIRDLTEGIPGTGVKAGIIGEIGADKWFVSATEERSFRGAARASVATGVPVYTHAARWHVGLDQVALLRHEGVDPAKIVVGHVDTVPTPGFAVELASTGVYIGLDTINSKNPAAVAPRVAQVLELVRAGYLERILLSHDVCVVSHLRAYGGNGFGFVLEGFRHALLEAGISAEEFDTMIRANPARLLG
ncbi:hypothetical protein B7R54_18060 [Subtercola boreus]|uniref:Phosphotriesterase-related protein n=1 Tax=Subtercola boreus TaxID=120213 RepID=A0A3E0VMQ5_9MICO|nr:phosphotriesterase [Subtercola boreus]RFA10899.1 hypothetical protein B7R54_18060 [Subtercola boreus]TQL55513.1 phosphotriesterase-related protein [Subtercola boreus]